MYTFEYPDEVIKELWNIREEHAARFNYDLEAMALDLKKEQEESDRKPAPFADEETRLPKHPNDAFGDRGLAVRKNEILEELWRIREEHAAKFNYDLEAIFEDLKKREKEDGREVVSFDSEEEPSKESLPAKAA